jgi:hypothetical protein
MLWPVLVTLATLAVLLPSPTAKPSQSPDTDQREIVALQLSRACADAADVFWKRFGYDKPSKPESDQVSVVFSYQSHYNREMKKCLISIRASTIYRNGRLQLLEEVADAVEAGEPLSSVLKENDKVLTMVKNSRQAEPTPENLAWFAGLMLK